MKTYYQKLMEIKRNPNLYLGYPSLKRLKSFMDGYMNCLYDITGKYDLGEFKDFQEWIENRYFHRGLAHNWAEIISFYNPLEERAFFEFYDLLEEYAVKHIN